MASNVFKVLINSIGNNFPSPPTLSFSDSEKSVATVSNGNIVLERKALALLCSYSDPESAIAYILSHELAHHYLNHSWMNKTGLSYASSIGELLSKRSDGHEQRKIEESQADLFGGFFSQISGYQSLSNASEILEDLYNLYDLPKNIEGYPTYEERQLIIDNNLKEIKKLQLIFEAGKLNIIKGDFEVAKDCFTHILNKKFTSREIYNNLGTVYLNMAINNCDSEISKYLYPIFYEANSRTQIEKSRGSIDTLSNPIEYLNSAIKMFERSISLDNDFFPAKKNLIISKMIEHKINDVNGSDEVTNKLNSLFKIENKDYYDILILNNLLFNKNKKGKVKKLVEKGGPISSYNYELEFSEKDNSNRQKYSSEKYKKIDLDKILFTGFNKPYEYTSSGNGIKIKKKQIDEDFIYEVNSSSYFLEINNLDYSSSKGIKIGNSIIEIELQYGIPDEIHSFGQNLYFSYKKSKIAFSTLNGKVTKIIIYS